MEAWLYESLENDRVRCNLCAHRCRIRPGDRGICGVRENRRGMLYTRVYGRLIARQVDPVEKKPLFHLAPGSLSYSVATVGCNFRCRFCQNADIAQLPADHGGRIAGGTVTPAEVVAEALRSGCRSIAYTYTEPTVYFEFACDTARLAHEAGLLNVFVTNGYMTAEALETVAPWLDAANVDLKSFRPEFYQRMCAARLDPVRQTLERMKSLDILTEVTTLLIPGENDGEEELSQMAAFIAAELGVDTPWHVSRFHPAYRLTDAPPTPVETVRRACEIGRAAGLHHVYAGNLPGDGGESTHCSVCRALLVDRRGYRIVSNRLKDGRCPDCQAPVKGVGM